MVPRLWCLGPIIRRCLAQNSIQRLAVKNASTIDLCLAIVFPPDVILAVTLADHVLLPWQWGGLGDALHRTPSTRLTLAATSSHRYSSTCISNFFGSGFRFTWGGMDGTEEEENLNESILRLVFLDFEDDGIEIFIWRHGRPCWRKMRQRHSKMMPTSSNDVTGTPLHHFSSRMAIKWHHCKPIVTHVCNSFRPPPHLGIRFRWQHSTWWEMFYALLI